MPTQTQTQIHKPPLSSPPSPYHRLKHRLGTYMQNSPRCLHHHHHWIKTRTVGSCTSGWEHWSPQPTINPHHHSQISTVSSSTIIHKSWHRCNDQSYVSAPVLLKTGSDMISAPSFVLSNREVLDIKCVEWIYDTCDDNQPLPQRTVPPFRWKWNLCTGAKKEWNRSNYFHVWVVKWTIVLADQMVDLDSRLIHKMAPQPLDASGKLIDTVSISMCHQAKSKYICQAWSIQQSHDYWPWYRSGWGWKCNIKSKTTDDVPHIFVKSQSSSHWRWTHEWRQNGARCQALLGKNSKTRSSERVRAGMEEDSGKNQPHVKSSFNGYWHRGDWGLSIYITEYLPFFGLWATVHFELTPLFILT